MFTTKFKYRIIFLQLQLHGKSKNAPINWGNKYFGLKLANDFLNPAKFKCNFEIVFQFYYWFSYDSFQVGVKRKIYPSFWQRPEIFMEGLRSKPVWSIEETDLSEKLKKVQNIWKVIRGVVFCDKKIRSLWIFSLLG